MTDTNKLEQIYKQLLASKGKNVNIYANQDVAQSEMQRRQQLADAMQVNALKSVSGPESGKSGNFESQAIMNPIVPISQVLMSYMADKQGKALNTEQSNLATQQVQDYAKGIQQYDQTAQQNPRQAIYDALASPNPQMRAYGQANLLKGPQENKYTQVDPDKMTIDQFGNYVQPKLPAGITPGAVPGVSADGMSGPGWKMQQLPDGSWTKITTAGPAMLDKAPKITNNLSANPTVMGQKGGMIEYFKNAANQVQEFGKGAKDANDMLQTIGDMKALDRQGIYSNATSGPTTMMANLAQGLGMKIDTSKLANTEAFNAMSIDLWLKYMNKAGGARGLTEPESNRIAKLAPMAAQSPQARQMLYDMAEKKAQRTVQQFGHVNKKFAEAVTSENPMIYSQGLEQLYNPEPNQSQPINPSNYNNNPSAQEPEIIGW